MNNPATAIKDLLETANVGEFAATTGWGLFVGKMPTTPDTVIACIVSGGQPSNPKYLIDYPSVQVIIRGARNNGYEDAYNKATAVKDALLGLPSQVIEGDNWVAINQIGDIATLGFDANNCPMFSVNFALIIEPASTTGTNRVTL
jgi:hypothetical protein